MTARIEEPLEALEPLTPRGELDTMTVMMIPPDHDLAGCDTRQLLTLGLRATWLRMCLSGRSAAMTPLDRDVLTAVAISPHGLVEADLLARARHMTPGSAHAWIEHLCTTWLTRRYVDDTAVIDLPTDDRAWIAARLDEVHPNLVQI